MSNVDEIIHGAIAEIDACGWTQRCLVDTEGSVCVDEAIHRSWRKLSMPVHDWVEAGQRVNDTVGGHRVTYNDDPATTKEDVILALKQAISTEVENS